MKNIYIVLLIPEFLSCSNHSPQNKTGYDAAESIHIEYETCPRVAGPSKCDDQASIVQGSIRLPEAFPGRTNGSIMLAMLHKRAGDPSKGGHPHWLWTFDDVDLTDSVFPFEVDMCDGNAVMWSEEKLRI